MGATLMVVILQLIRFGLIGVSLYLLYVAVQQPEWLMLSAIVLNIVYLVAIPRLSRLMKQWFDGRKSTKRGHRTEHWPELEAPNTAQAREAMWSSPKTTADTDWHYA
jgi:hypothetical protein